ncbi:hypothetical protein DFP72DRAFT_21480 [Ephemerocybe angulata]|uniref:RNA-binding domain-containing protein n=1 Tax=Ephemerocybe angulata TaxID=980116 RepID=A0A8H6IKR3_9AGAR|nr:hypothetical protein DFP72DRAFT_21480 [Tulosesus angulatus]
MAAVNTPPEDVPMQAAWGPQDDQTLGPISNGNGQPANGASMAGDDNHQGQEPENGADYPPRGSSVGDVSVNGGSKADNYRGEKQVKPNKVYIGGLPENTREEDLQNCFGKIGKITNIELKVGYGFVEFEQREAAEESVAKYHEGFFMGQKIRVELSHGGGRTAKYAGEPGACFRCGQQGHWARECPNQSHGGSRARNYEPLVDRVQRDYPPRSVPPRDDYPPARYPPARDARYDYAPPPPRDYRRAPSPSPREYRDYPPPPPRGRDYDDYGRRGPPPPPVHDRDRYTPVVPVPPPADYAPRGRYAPPPVESYRGYSGPPPPPPASYDRYDGRPADRYPSAYPPPPPPPAGGRARSPPPRDYDRAPPRDYPDYRRRPVTPPRYPPGDYPRASAEPPSTRYRRRSVSPGPVRSPVAYDMYPAAGYSGNVQPAPRRDYPAPPRAGRDIEPAPYRRQ